MNEAKLVSFLQSVCEDHKLNQFISDGEERFKATIYCKIRGEDYDAKCAEFMDKFTMDTNTSWIVYKRYGKQKRNLFRKTFKCQHTSFNKVKGERKYKNRIRSQACKAVVDFRFKKVCRDTWKNDPNLKTGLSCIIQIQFDHTHPINVAEAFSFLRCSKKTIDNFYSYFDSGMTASAAKNYHEIKFIENIVDENVIIKTLANTQLNPTLRQVIHLFENWRRTKCDERNQDNIVECLKKMKSFLKETGNDLIIDEETMTVVVVTPIMKSVFALEEANEMVFIDSSGFCDQTNTCVTFLFCGSKVGALPLGCILHTSLKEKGYSKSFTLLKNALESNGSKRFNPSVIMTDDCTAERSALQCVFPEARFLLCNFHVSQAVWRSLWDEDNIEKDDRQSIMERFQQVLNADSTTSANSHYEELISSVEPKYPNAKEHFESLWKRKDEWCYPYCEGRKNTNNYCEASIRIFKDIVLQRYKILNSCAFVDYICNDFDNYHKERLIEFASSRGQQKLQPHYSKFLTETDTNEIMQQSKYEFKVTCLTDVHTVNTKWQTCDCLFGRGGRYCKHMFAVDVNYNIQMSTCPLLTVEEKIQFAKIALGTNVSIDLYKEMDIEDASGPRQYNLPFDESMTSERHESDEANYKFTNHNSSERDDVLALTHSLRKEFNRIVDIIETNPTSVNFSALKKTARKIKYIKTPVQVLSFFRGKLKAMKRSIVQPTSISRRKDRGISKGRRRVQSGRPTMIEVTKPNLALSVNNNNNQNAKLHC